ncbi:hypothetical protein CHUAL_012125 [Chamberlinius hualienensis]
MVHLVKLLNFLLICQFGHSKFVSKSVKKVSNGHRPIQPSMELPIKDLIEPPDSVYDPKVEDLDTQLLMTKLGKHFDGQFMSLKRPIDSILAPNGTLDVNFMRNRNGHWVPKGRMPLDIKKLKFKSWSSWTEIAPNGNASPKLRRKMRQFLWSYTYCPVVHVWKDLGIRFWPRWLRQGHCYSRHSCSFPRGMSCKPYKSDNKTVLRWHCQDWNKASYCKWIQVSYPVVVQCNCSC